MFLTILSLLACGEKSNDTGMTSDTSNTTTTDTTEIDPCAPLEGIEGIGMTGSIIFSDGTEAMGNVRVQMCNEGTCYVAKWNDDGFCFPEGTLTPNVPYAFDLVPTVDSEKYANPLTFLTPTENVTLTDPVIIPEYSNNGSGAESFDAGNGLTIVGSADLPETIFSVPVDLEGGGLPFENIDTSKIVGAWYLGPFDVHLENAATMTFSNENIVAGNTYTILNGDYESQQWIETVSITAEENGILNIDEGLQILSTLLIKQ